MRKHDFYKVDYSKKDDKFSKVHNRLIHSVPETVWKHQQKLPLKKKREKLHTMLWIRRNQNSRNVSSSDIVEEVGIIDQLLDDFIT